MSCGCNNNGKSVPGSVDEINTPSNKVSPHTISPYNVAPGVKPAGAIIIGSAPPVPHHPHGCKCHTCCDNVQHATPKPFYECAPVAAEDHARCVNTINYATAIKVENSWNVPACSASATLTVPGLSSIVIGTYLYGGPSIGYFEVLSFNPLTHQLIVQNNCTPGNATVGSTIPACTLFAVTPPPVDASGGGGGAPTIYPYLAVDFTAPGNGQCIPITVTTTQGLSVGKNVQIGTGVYQVQSISSSTAMAICNQGIGAIPGTPVLAYNSAGQLQFPVVQLDTNPCTNAVIPSGAVMVCNNGLQAPLSGPAEGAVLVYTSTANHTAEFRSLGLPTRTCSPLTCSTPIVAGTANYSIQVADTSGFSLGQILQIGSRTDRFTVTALVSPTVMQGTISPTPGVSTTLPAGTSVCAVDCCEINKAEIDALYANIFEAGSTNTSTGTIADGSQSITGTKASISITNFSPIHTAAILVVVQGRYSGNIQNAPSQAVSQYAYNDYIQLDGGTPQLLSHQRQDYVAHASDDLHQTRYTSTSFVIQVSPGATRLFEAYSVLAGVGGWSASGYTNLELSTKMSGVLVAVH